MNWSETRPGEVSFKRGDVIRSKRFPNSGHKRVTSVTRRETRYKDLTPWGSTGTLGDLDDWELVPAADLGAPQLFETGRAVGT